MSAVLIFFAGVGVGGIGIAALIFLGRPPRGGLPDATPHAIARAARRNRLDLRPARAAGVLVDARHVLRDNPPRLERAPAPLTSFDEEASHGD